MTDSASDAVLMNVAFKQVHELLPGRRLIDAAEIPNLTPQDRAAVRVMVVHGGRPLGGADMDAYPNLGRIVAVGAGFEGVDAAAAEARGVQIVSSAGANAPVVADTAAGMVIALTRGFVANDARVRAGDWKAGQFLPVRSLSALKVGIVGLGFIGQAIAERLAPFRCAIAYTGRRAKPEVALPYAPSVLELARQSDVLVLAALLDASTAGMVSAEVIDALGPKGFLVNVGRGGLVDEDALIAALKEGRLAGAGLDVFAEEPTPPARWDGVPNVLLSPHTAAVTYTALNAVYDVTARHVTDFLDAPRG